MLPSTNGISRFGLFYYVRGRRYQLVCYRTNSSKRSTLVGRYGGRLIRAGEFPHPGPKLKYIFCSIFFFPGSENLFFHSLFFFSFAYISFLFCFILLNQLISSASVLFPSWSWCARLLRYNGLAHCSLAAREPSSPGKKSRQTRHRLLGSTGREKNEN